MNKNYIWFITLLLLACNNNYNKVNPCDITGFKELNLYPVHTILKLPEYRFVDSLVYGKVTIINYKVKALDSSFNLVAFVDSYEKDPNSLVSINQIMTFQKEQVEDGMDSVKLLKDTIINRNNITIGYIKYFVQQKEKKYYESRVAFYRGRILVKLWFFENFEGKTKTNGSIIDCILGNIIFK